MSNIAVGSKGKVNANSVNVRKDAGTSYNRVYYAQSGDIVVVQARKTGTDGNLWYKITNETRYTTSVGYIRNDFVDAYTGGSDGGSGTTSNINVGDTVITILPAVNFRSTPGGTSLFQVSTGTTMAVTAITTSGGYTWYGGVLSAKTGYLRGDCVEKYTGGSTGSGTTSNGLQAGHYVQVSSSYSTVNVRASTSKTSTLRGVLFKGTKVYCSAVVNDSWVKIIWGGKGSSEAYVMAQYLVDGGVAPSSKRDRAIAIANSMKDAGYPYNDRIGNLGLDSDKWCVQYCSWLMKAAGCSVYPDFSQNATVSGAISFFGSSYGNKGTKTPVKGDWVFYTTTGSTSSNPDAYYAHVGMVVNVSGNNITTVEGNLSDTITSPGTYNYTTATHIGDNDFSVLGFATPNWN